MAQKKRSPPSSSSKPRAAGLVYVHDSMPGLSRKRRGRGFSYHDPEGELVKSAETLQRIRSLAIPPAYSDVWICPHSRGHLQATGRDAKRRKQYRYHPGWSAHRNTTKFSSLAVFGEALPEIRRRIRLDLRKPGVERERVLAAVALLLDRTHLRIGNDAYTRKNGSYGLSTITEKHADIDPDTGHVELEFVGKSGMTNRAKLYHPTIAKVMLRCADLPGQHLFAYLDEAGECREVGSGEVNDYLREIGGEDISTKHFRTWAGTVTCADLLASNEKPGSEAEAKRSVAAAIKATAAVLQNRPATCRKYYVHPRVIETFSNGKLQNEFARPLKGTPEGLAESEARVLRLIR
ncbi:DNA topoisomerase IB [soil metagenome]